VSLSTDDNLLQAMIFSQRIMKWENHLKSDPKSLTSSLLEGEQLLSEVK